MIIVNDLLKFLINYPIKLVFLTYYNFPFCLVLIHSIEKNVLFARGGRERENAVGGTRPMP